MDTSRQPEWDSVYAEAGVANPNIHDDMKKTNTETSIMILSEMK